jgi:hypothetical protein
VDPDIIIRDVSAVTKKWTRQRKAEERSASARERREHLYSTFRYTAKDAAQDAIPEAYRKVSDGGKLPAHARQIMYAARDSIQEYTGEQLNDKYFTQTLLPDYMNDNPGATADWDVVFDARGHFLEPHTGHEVPLGTLEVRQYLSDDSRDAPVLVRGLFPTHGPANRFGALMFIEKEGFFPLLRRVRLAERYDLAIMSTKGMSVVAARRLVDALCGRDGIPLLILHDFDKAGFSILGTLQRDNRRYQFRNELRAIDLGLRLPDVQSCGLASERVFFPANASLATIRANLRHNGASREEVDFLAGSRPEARRVELNAFTSRPLVDWLEGKLREHGVKKVLPGKDVLEEAYRRAFTREFVRGAIPGLKAEARHHLDANGVPRDLKKRVAAALAERAQEPWDNAISRLARQAVRRVEEEGE